MLFIEAFNILRQHWLLLNKLLQQTCYEIGCCLVFHIIDAVNIPDADTVLLGPSFEVVNNDRSRVSRG